MLSQSSQVGPKGIVPDHVASTRSLRCFMFYEWEALYDRRLLDLGDRLLAEFGASSVEETGNLGDKKIHGSYKKARPVLENFFERCGSDLHPGIRLRSAPARDNDFFPSDIEFDAHVKLSGQKQGVFAVDETLVASIRKLSERVASIIFDGLGAGYGACWDFPSELGVEGYLASVSMMPSGMKWGADEKYAARLNRWRDNVWHRKLRARDGYFREIYPINFLLETHLSMPFRDAPLSKFMETAGSLQSCEFNHKMYRWDVPDENLGEVREALDPSGLILSSEAEPLQIN